MERLAAEVCKGPVNHADGEAEAPAEACEEAAAGPGAAAGEACTVDKEAAAEDDDNAIEALEAKLEEKRWVFFCFFSIAPFSPSLRKVA